MRLEEGRARILLMRDGVFYGTRYLFLLVRQRARRSAWNLLVDVPCLLVFLPFAVVGDLLSFRGDLKKA